MGRSPSPLNEVVEEVQQARVGVLGVLDQQHYGVDGGEAFQEQPPPGEQLLPRQRLPAVPCAADAKQQAEPGADVAPLRRIGDVFRQARR